MMKGTTQTTSVISGVIRDQAGNPVPQARVSFVGGPRELPDIAALTDINGNFALSAPVAGEYVIQVDSDEFVTMRVKFAVESNQGKHIEIRLSPRSE
jgi:hypothetical protein